MPVQMPSLPRIVTPAAYVANAAPPADARPRAGPAHRIVAVNPAPGPAAGPAPDLTALEARERTRRVGEPGWQPQPDSPDFKPFGDDGLTFGDLIDVVNPLQHLPVLGNVYRWLTGDDLSPAARVAGGALYGGPIGLAGSIGQLIANGIIGGAPDQQVLTALLGPSPFADPAEGATTVAALAPDAAPNAAPSPVEGGFLPLAGPANVPAAPAIAPMIPLETGGGAAPMIPLAGSGAPSPIELDQGQEAALLRFLESQSPVGAPTAAGTSPAPVIDIGPQPAPGLDLPGSIPLEMSRALESYRRQQQPPDAALAPDIELDIRS
jgi:hypothetical protein